MTITVKSIKKKVHSLPSHSLPTEKDRYIIESDASQKAWGGVLLEEIEGK